MNNNNYFPNIKDHLEKVNKQIDSVQQNIRKSFNQYRQSTQQFIFAEENMSQKLNSFFNMQDQQINNKEWWVKELMNEEIKQMKERFTEQITLIEKVLISEYEQIFQKMQEIEANFQNFLKNSSPHNISQSISLEKLIEKFQNYETPLFLQQANRNQIFQSGQKAKQQNLEQKQFGNQSSQDYQSAKQKKIPINHSEIEYEGIFNPNGISITSLLVKEELLVIGGYDGKLSILNRLNEEIIFEFEKFHKHKICGIIQLESGFVATSSSDSTIKILNLQVIQQSLKNSQQQKSQDNEEEEQQSDDKIEKIKFEIPKDFIVKTVNLGQNLSLKCLTEIGPSNYLNPHHLIVGLTETDKLIGFNLFGESEKQQKIVDSQILYETTSEYSLTCLKKIQIKENEDLLFAGDIKGSIVIFSFQEGIFSVIQKLNFVQQDQITDLDVRIQEIQTVSNTAVFEVLSTSYDGLPQISMILVDHNKQENSVEFQTQFFLAGHSSTVSRGLLSSDGRRAVTIGGQDLIYWENGQEKFRSQVSLDNLGIIVEADRLSVFDSFFVAGVSSESFIVKLEFSDQEPVEEKQMIEEVEGLQKEIGTENLQNNQTKIAKTIVDSIIDHI